MSYIKCNSCELPKPETEYNKSDISQRRYTCKICKKTQRDIWKATRKFPDTISCKNCHQPKDKSEFILSDLQNSTFYCRVCHNELNLINVKRQKEQP